MHLTPELQNILRRAPAKNGRRKGFISLPISEMNISELRYLLWQLRCQNSLINRKYLEIKRNVTTEISKLTEQNRQLTETIHNLQNEVILLNKAMHHADTLRMFAAPPSDPNLALGFNVRTQMYDDARKRLKC